MVVLSRPSTSNFFLPIGTLLTYCYEYTDSLFMDNDPTTKRTTSNRLLVKAFARTQAEDSFGTPEHPRR